MSKTTALGWWHPDPKHQRLLTESLTALLFLPLLFTHHPWFVTEVVNRVQRVHTWQSGVLQSDHHVPVVSILVHAEGMLSDQHKVWLNGSNTEDISKTLNCVSRQVEQQQGWIST